MALALPVTAIPSSLSASTSIRPAASSCSSCACRRPGAGSPPGKRKAGTGSATSSSCRFSHWSCSGFFSSSTRRSLRESTPSPSTPATNKAVMSEAYARGGQPRNIAGGVILILSSLLAAFGVTAGLVYAMGTSARHAAAITSAGCEPGLAPAGLQWTTAQLRPSQYTAIVPPASQQLATDMAAYTANERRNLAAADMAL